MNNEREKRIFEAARQLLTADQKRMIAAEAGISYSYLQNIIARRQVDRHGIAERCAAILNDDWSSMKYQIRELRKIQRRIEKLNMKQVLKAAEVLSR